MSVDKRPTHICRQLQEDILDHLLDVLSSERSSTLVTDHQNICKELISKNGVECVRNNVLRALDPDITSSLQKGQLTSQTLSNLDREKAKEYDAAGVYLHVILELDQRSIYWLNVGAGMNVRSRMKEHKRFRTAPSRNSLHYRVWNQGGRGDFFALLGGFSNIHVLKQDQVAMDNLLEGFGLSGISNTPKGCAAKSTSKKQLTSFNSNRVSPLRLVYNFQSDK